MPRAVWGTPQPASATDYVTDEPRGILGFLGGGQDIGADIGDRAGIISQILMNLGSGRGGAGIAEATMAANERSAARREDNRNKAMVNRMADKLEPSNPEMAMMMRANTKFGMQMLGKQLEDEWTSKSDMAKLNKEYELRGANDLALQAQKAKDKQRDITARLASMGLNVDYGDTPASNAPVPTVADAGVIPSPTSSLGGGGSDPVVPDQPAPAPTGGGVDYTVGLTDNPQLRAVQIQQRKLYNDPDMPIEDVLTLIDSGFTDTSEGANLVRKNVNARKEKRARVQGLQDKAAAADATFQAAQGLPGINMNAPGEDLMRGVGIDPKLRPDLNPAQTAERLQTAVQDPEQYNSLLGNLAKPAANPGSVRFNPQTGELEVVPGGKADTEGQARAASLAQRMQISLPILDDPEKSAALMTGIDPFIDQALPDWLNNSLGLLSPDFRLAKIAGANYLAAVLRYDSMATIKQEEFDMYGPFLLPQRGDDADTLKFKSELRQRTFIGLARNMSPTAQLDYAATATRQRKEALARGEAPPPLPDISQWPTGTGTEGTQPAATGTQPAPAPSPIDDLLKKYPPKPAAGP